MIINSASKPLDITSKEVITELKLILSDVKVLETFAYQKLHDLGIRIDDVDNIFGEDVSNRLEWLIFVLENLD